LPGLGGVGGGGTGGYNTATAGAVNTGGGGGGGAAGYTGAAGGSGIVIVRYPGNIVFYTGGTVNYNNGYISHIFNSNGTLAPTTPTAYNTSYQISRSLRFNSADSAYLDRAQTTGDTQKATWSGWVKRSALTIGAYSTLFSAGTSNTDTLTWNNTGDTLRFFLNGASSADLVTTQVFRDSSAWYHIVIAIDTTQATAANRILMYINGVQVTAFTTATYPTQNYTFTRLNTSGYSANLGSIGTGSFLSAYMTEVNFIDGQALTPSSFGATSTTTGVWAPIKYTGTYGTNGFYINFSDNTNTTAATLGKDYSGNGNNFTPNNFSVTAGAGNDSMVDTPTPYGFDTGVGGTVRGNYSTMNPINKGSTVTLSNGNLDQVTASGGWNSARASIAVASGKWYWEVTITGTTQTVMHGVDDNTYNVTTNPSSAYVGAYNNSWGVYASNGQKRNNTGSGTAYGSAFAQNDVMIVAMDMDSGKIWWGKNGTWFASGDPVAGTNAAYTNLSGYTLNPATSGFDTTDSCTHNFGQRPFAYTAPTGFKALNTQNLPTPAIGGSSETLASKFFGINLYTGTSATQAIVNSGAFQPDWIWIKDRSVNRSHRLMDSVRGINKVLYTDLAIAEDTGSCLSSINSNGFTLNTTDNMNLTGETYVAWQWRAGNNAGSTNKDGSSISNVSANRTSGFSIVTYTGTGSAATVGHGLGVAPSFYVVKERSGSSYNWNSYHVALGNTKYIALNTTDAQGSVVALWSDTSPTSTVFSISSAAAVNTSATTYVAYCFAEVAGYSKFGSYTANANADGPFLYTGFRPAFIMLKRYDASGAPWTMIDVVRSPYNAAVLELDANATTAEYSAGNGMDILSNGFKLRDGSYFNSSNGNVFLYMAFASHPFKYALAR
jgi:hypothetical protein